MDYHQRSWDLLFAAAHIGVQKPGQLLDCINTLPVGAFEASAWSRNFWIRICFADRRYLRSFNFRSQIRTSSIHCYDGTENRQNANQCAMLKEESSWSSRSRRNELPAWTEGLPGLPTASSDRGQQTSDRLLLELTIAEIGSILHPFRHSKTVTKCQEGIPNTISPTHAPEAS